MDKKVREELLKRISFEIFPKEGWDSYEIKVCFENKIIGWIEVNGLELASWEPGKEKTK